MTNNLKVSISRIRNPFWQLSSVTLPRHAIKVSTDRIQNSRERKLKKDKQKPFLSVVVILVIWPWSHTLTPALMHDGDQRLIHRHTERMETIDLMVSFSWNSRRRWIINIFGFCLSGFCLQEKSLLTQPGAKLALACKSLCYNNNNRWDNDM